MEYGSHGTQRACHTSSFGRTVPAVPAAVCGTAASHPHKSTWYMRHRESILLATRLVRGGWMVVMMLITPEADIVSSFTARRLAAGASPQLVVLRLLMLFTLIFLGQCLCWPLHFKRALPLQAAYVCTSLAAMRSVKCVLQSPGIDAGARVLRHKVNLTVNCLTALLEDAQLSCLVPLGDAAPLGLRGAATHQDTAGTADDSCSGSSCARGSLCGPRSSEEVLFFWLVTFGLLLPLYIMYLRELSFKQRFLRALLCHQLQQQQQQQQASVVAAAAAGNQQQLLGQSAGLLHGNGSAVAGGVLQLRPLLHGVAACIMLIISAVVSEQLLLALPPPVCA
ncbi:hypothetical protein COO60DRAFT_1029512 [Scenedesmus sp. NREL 46B-D3]|nr:hypothetical protein COO60DRAFT_1029512 [Scenedesmus sp. NREL 46B-D3]